jgi:hypothetical protein
MNLIARKVSELLASLSLGARRRKVRQAADAYDALETRVVPAVAFALTTDNKIVTFDTASPGTTQTSVPVTGTSGEVLLSIDLRPRDGKIYALGDAGRLYTVNPSTGVSTLVTNTAVTGFPTSTTAFGTDFNPTVDRFRVVNDLDANLRINVATAATTVDTNLAYAGADTNAAANPNNVASAYTNNHFDSTTTTLFNIDSNLDILVRQVPPNNGTLNTVGALGVDTSFLVGFDIQEASNTAFAALHVAGKSGLYTINLTTGAATKVGDFATGVTVKGLAVTGETKINRMYRSYTATTQDHFYTPNEAEFLNARDKFGYVDQASGRAGFGVANAQVAGSSPLYRLYNGSAGIHYYTLNQGERDSLVSSKAFTDEGIIGYMFTSQAAAVGQTVTQVFHLYNNVSGGHLFTENIGTVNAILGQFPGIWVQQTALGFAYALGTQYTAPAVSAAATAAAATSSESTTTTTATSTSVADSGLIASSTTVTSSTAVAPTSAAAEAASTTIGGDDSEDVAAVDAVFSSDLGSLLGTL